jgi:hypothetical protein
MQSKTVIGWQKTLIYNLFFQEPIEHAPGTVCMVQYVRYVQYVQAGNPWVTLLAVVLC